MFTDFLSSASDAVSGFVSRAKNKPFMQAVAATAAIVAYADGSLDQSEKRKILGFIQNTPALKSFNSADILKLFEDYGRQLEFDYDFGKEGLLAVVGNGATDTTSGRLLALIAAGVAKADGQVPEVERKAVAEICSRTGQSISTLSL